MLLRVTLFICNKEKQNTVPGKFIRVIELGEAYDKVYSDLTERIQIILL